jgi:hypothetical protein
MFRLKNVINRYLTHVKIKVIGLKEICEKLIPEDTPALGGIRCKGDIEMVTKLFSVR